jgi:hypothetical protein
MRKEAGRIGEARDTGQIGLPGDEASGVAMKR